MAGLVDTGRGRQDQKPAPAEICSIPLPPAAPGSTGRRIGRQSALRYRGQGPFVSASIVTCPRPSFGAMAASFPGLRSRFGAGKNLCPMAKPNRRAPILSIPHGVRCAPARHHATASRNEDRCHVHGAVVPPESDGQPDAWFTAGLPNGVAPNGPEETYAYPDQQEACTLWYHDHAIGQTVSTSMPGLAGAYIIRDDEEDALGLPSGEHEIALIIQDRSFGTGWSLTYPVSEFAGSVDHPGPWVPEFFGDTIC